MGTISIIRRFQIGCPQEYSVREGCPLTRSVRKIITNLTPEFMQCFYGKSFVIGNTLIADGAEISMCLLPCLTEFSPLIITPREFLAIDIRYTGFVPMGQVCGMNFDLNLLLVW